jgi:hypothetical protein
VQVNILEAKNQLSKRSLRFSQARIDAAFTKEVDEEVARVI